MQISDESGERRNGGGRWSRKDITMTDKVTVLKVKLWEQRFLHDNNLRVGKKVLFRNLETNVVVVVIDNRDNLRGTVYIINLSRGCLSITVRETRTGAITPPLSTPLIVAKARFIHDVELII